MTDERFEEIIKDKTKCEFCADLGNADICIKCREVTPISYAELKEFWQKIKSINDFPNSQLAKVLAELQKYQRAEAEGLLVRLPCKIGNTAWVNPLCLYIPHGINKNIPVECEVISFKKTKHRGLIILLKPIGLECFIGRASYKWFPKSSIGKTVFLTREEAEQALKEARQSNE